MRRGEGEGGREESRRRARPLGRWQESCRAGVGMVKGAGEQGGTNWGVVPASGSRLEGSGRSAR